MKLSAIILVASFGSAAAAAITLDENEFSVNDKNVVVEFKNPEDALYTDWVGIFDKKDDYKEFVYTCGSIDSGLCANSQAKKEGTVIFNFKSNPYLLAGTYTVCLMKEVGDYYNNEVIGQCQEIELVGTKKSPIKINKKISMYDSTVKVKFNNPDEPGSTNWVGFYDLEDQFVQPFSYTCGSDNYEECKNEPAEKKAKVSLNFTDASMQAGKYNACLMDDTDPYNYFDSYQKQIGICQKITVFDPNCKKIDTKAECKEISSCTWKNKRKNKCK